MTSVAVSANRVPVPQDLVPLSSAPSRDAARTIRTFNRFELKYLLKRETAEQVKAAIAPYVVKDPHGGADAGTYRLGSLYYDTEDFRFYWEKIEGLKFRRKLRLRAYVGDRALTDDDQVFLEIKQRVDRVTQKRRVSLSYGEALAFVRNGTHPKHADGARRVLDEINQLMTFYRLTPALITQYEREAFFGTEYESGLRITFDRDIRFRRANLNLNDNAPADGDIVPPNYVVMEIKTNERLPYWVTELVSEFNVRLIRISKYCSGLEAAAAVPSSRVHQF